MVPGLGSVDEAAKLANKGMNILGRVANSGIVQGALKVAGRPVHGVGADLKDIYGADNWREKAKKEATGPAFWARHHLLTYGILGGVGCWVGSLALGQFIKKDPETYGKLGPISGLLNIASFIGVAGSIYSQYHGIHYKAFGDLEYGRAKFGGIQERSKVLTSVDDKHLKSQKELFGKFIKFNNSESKPEQDEVIRVFDEVNRGARVKKFFVGGAGTGKTHTMDAVCQAIKDYEASKELKDGEQRKEVVIKTLNISELVKALTAVNSKISEAGNVLDAVGIDSGILALGKENPQLMLLTSIDAIIDEAKLAEKNGKRFVLYVDEIHQIWKLAKSGEGYDNPTLGIIANQFQKLLELNNIDVLMTSNEEPSSMMGFEKLAKEGRTDELPQDLVGLVDRLRKVRVAITEPEFETQARIAAAYILNLPEELGVSRDKIYSDEVKNILSSKRQNESEEDALTRVIYEQNYVQKGVLSVDTRRAKHYLSRNPEAFFNAKALEKLNGRLIHNAINVNYGSDLITKPKDGQVAPKVTIAGVGNYLMRILAGEREDVKKMYESDLREIDDVRFREGLALEERQNQEEQRILKLREREDELNEPFRDVFKLFEDNHASSEMIAMIGEEMGGKDFLDQLRELNTTEARKISAMILKAKADIKIASKKAA